MKRRGLTLASLILALIAVHGHSQQSKPSLFVGTGGESGSPGGRGDGTRALAPSQNPSVQKSADTKLAGMSAMTLLTNLPASGAPITITNILLDNRPVGINNPIAVKGMWVSKLRISVTNTSSRPIVAGDAAIVFPETGDGSTDHPIISAIMNLGRPPAAAFRRKDGILIPLHEAALAREPMIIRPGETMEFHSVTCPGGIQSGDPEQTAAYSAAQISRARIEFRNFYFSDGSKWTGHSYLEPAEPPALWKEVPASQFLSASRPAHQ